jgi:hypothetical protein
LNGEFRPGGVTPCEHFDQSVEIRRLLTFRLTEPFIESNKDFFVTESTRFPLSGRSGRSGERIRHFALGKHGGG